MAGLEMDSGNMLPTAFNKFLCSAYFDLSMVFLWIFMIPLSIFTGWIYSVAFVAAISLYANVASHWAAYRAARTEKRQEELLNGH
jgi:hypothetical protein